MSAAARPQRQGVFQFEPYLDQKVSVKLNGGRELVGTLRGFDTQQNLILEGALEYIRSADDVYSRFAPPKTRSLGVAIIRGPQIVRFCPDEGFQQLESPLGKAE
eukprot:ANDGO_08247.mRNA.1 Sm-like protein LSM7